MVDNNKMKQVESSIMAFVLWDIVCNYKHLLAIGDIGETKYEAHIYAGELELNTLLHAVDHYLRSVMTRWIDAIR